MLAFLVTRSWYTDSVVVFFHICICSYHRYLLAWVLHTRHCAGCLGYSREWKKADFCPLESSGSLSEIKWRRRGACQLGTYWGLFCKGKAWFTKEPEQLGKLDIQRHCDLSHVSLWKSSISLYLWICLEVRPPQLIWALADTHGLPLLFHLSWRTQAVPAEGC